MKTTLAVVATISLLPLAFFWHSEGTEKVPYGIKKRIPWTTSRIKGSLLPPAPYKIERVFPNLTFDHPTDMCNLSGSDRLFMVELKGKIYSFPIKRDVRKPDLFADLDQISKGKLRAYRIAFQPKFEQNRYCFVCYILKQNLPQGTRVSRFKVTNTDPPTLDLSSEQVLLTWPSGGHNGGCLKFGPDGYLYISAGDAGPAFPPDPIRTGQDISDLPGSIMRIDVDNTTDGLPYAIPKDNPFLHIPDARPEVWAYGLRNPWKMSFDPVSKELWVGDVGWEMWELVYRIERGGNYGWSLVEGSQPVLQETKRGPTPIISPIIQHPHTEARSVTGGYIYRGSRLKELVGTYIYGDYVTGKIWGLKHDGKKITWQKELVDTPLAIICFGTDNANRLYIVGYDGTIFRLVPNESAGVNRNFPRKLSETGLFRSVKKYEFAGGVIPYTINAEPWMDGATADRFVALPGLSRIGVHQKQDIWLGKIKGKWAFPSDAVLGKTISLDMEYGNPKSKKRLETQILHLDGDTWRGYTYIWNKEQTDAFLARKEGLDKTFQIKDIRNPSGQRKQVWHYPSRMECLLCHTTRAGTIHGFNQKQLDRTHQYGTTKADQLASLDHINLFKQPLKEDVERWSSPYDQGISLENRVRLYLHLNCAHCHLRGGGGTAAIDLRYHLKLKRTKLIGERPTQGTFAIHRAQVVAPGDPYRSILYYRMAKLGQGRMPHFGSKVVDMEGLKLIHDWIRQIPEDESVPDSVRNLREEQQEVLQEIISGKTSELTRAIDKLLCSPSGALMVMSAIDRGRIAPPVKKVIVASAAKKETHIRDLFERFLPEELKRKRLGNFIKPEAILSLQGDPGRGKKLFFQSKVAQCRNCHRIQGEGIDFGPDLSQIGKKYDRAKLLESILKPSKNVEAKYVSYLVETKRGKVHTGLVVKKTDQELVLRSQQNQDIRIAAKEVELITPVRTSIMPERLVRDMTGQELADLLEYLSSLK